MWPAELSCDRKSAIRCSYRVKKQHRWQELFLSRSPLHRTLTGLTGAGGSLHSVWEKLVTGAVFCLCSSFSLFVFCSITAWRVAEEDAAVCYSQFVSPLEGIMCTMSNWKACTGGTNSVEQWTDTSAGVRCTLWSYTLQEGEVGERLTALNVEIKTHWFSINCGHSRAGSTFHPECSPGWCIDDLSKGGSGLHSQIHTKPSSSPAKNGGSEAVVKQTSPRRSFSDTTRRK